MSTNPTADEVVYQKHMRAFTQRGGPAPENRVRYAGPDEQYIAIGDIANPVRGGVEAVRVHDPYRRDAYRLISRTVSPPDLPSSTITFMKKHGGVSYWVGDLTCEQNFYELVGTCTRPDDFVYGWDDFVTVLSRGLAGDRTHTGRTSRGEDNDEEAGAGLGFVDVYDTRGRLVRRLASGGPLNAPWGMALAPEHFGHFGGDVLVGNFGDGRIMAFDREGHFDGYLRGADHKPIEIDGLWGIGFGNGKQAGPTDTLFFAAGTNDEANGLFGSLTLKAGGRRGD